ncbi:DinB family protein [Nocardia thailandica]|uniref:DinB family protein n=1 Tax=Nocardia thailandica TaxID=257275 RepID=A0ABW6PSG8_9NOCA
MTTASLPQLDAERADLLETLGKARHFLRYTAQNLTDEQAGQRTTVSELCVGGLIKHVTAVEKNWATFIVEGPAAAPSFDEMTEEDIARWSSQFRMLPEDTLADVLATYEAVAAETDRLVREVPDLNLSHPLPEAPWFEPGARWTVRRTLMHIAAETAQHAGHADIIRESLDGQKSMG